MTQTDYQIQVANNLAELAKLHGAMLGSLNVGAGQNSRQNNATQGSISNPVVTSRRPWIDPPEGYVPYDFRSKIALPVVGSTVIVLTMQVPTGYDGVINGYSWNFTGGGFVEASGDIIVRILRNNAPIRNFDNITVEAGTIQNQRQISPIRIYSTQIIEITVTHNANGLLAGDVVGSLVGYFYPSMG